MISIFLPLLPPSTNHAYTTIKLGRKGTKRVLTKKGNAFLKEATAHFSQNCQEQMLFFEADMPYLLYTHFLFREEELYSKTWPKTDVARYKKLDVTNRVKLIEDALCTAAGIDDSQHFVVILAKSSPLPNREEGVEINVWNLDKEVTPFDRGLML